MTNNTNTNRPPASLVEVYGTDRVYKNLGDGCWESPDGIFIVGK